MGLGDVRPVVGESLAWPSSMGDVSWAPVRGRSLILGWWGAPERL